MLLLAAASQFHLHGVTNAAAGRIEHAYVSFGAGPAPGLNALETAHATGAQLFVESAVLSG